MACHGDCHGGNNFVRTTDAGVREAVFFDFDDAAPGFLAYDLAVFHWDQLLGGGHAAPTGEMSDRWGQYLDGYRRRRDLASVDIEAIPDFVRMRHILWLGEHAGRLSQWGSGALPYPWLLEQADLLEKRRALGTAAP